MKLFTQAITTLQELTVGTEVILRNSANDGCKGGKLQFKWFQHPYEIEEDLGKGCFRLKNPKTGHVLKKAVNSCHLKKYFQPEIDEIPPTSSPDKKTSSPAKKKRKVHS